MECDGSGNEVYYEWKGQQWLLCETLVPHKHCECGEPMSILSGCCQYCNLERQGLTVHFQEGTLREKVEHGDTTLANKRWTIAMREFSVIESYKQRLGESRRNSETPLS